MKKLIINILLNLHSLIETLLYKIDKNALYDMRFFKNPASIISPAEQLFIIQNLDEVRDFLFKK